MPFQLKRDFIEPDAKLAGLDRAGVGAAVVSLAPPLFYYDVEPQTAESFSRIVNAGLRDFCAVAQERSRWMAHVPMCSPTVDDRHGRLHCFDSEKWLAALTHRCRSHLSGPPSPPAPAERTL